VSEEKISNLNHNEFEQQRVKSKPVSEEKISNLNHNSLKDLKIQEIIQEFKAYNPSDFQSIKAESNKALNANNSFQNINMEDLWDKQPNFELNNLRSLYSGP